MESRPYTQLLEFDLDQPWREMPLAFVDMETTGLDTSVDRVLEIAIVTCRSVVVEERWVHLVDPGVAVPPEATAVHGIADDDLQGKPTFRDVVWDVHARLRGRAMVAYNALAFDRPVLQAEMQRCGITLPIQPVLDPLLWVYHWMPTRSGGPDSLSRVCARLDISVGAAHRALDDCEALVAVTDRLARRVPETLGELLRAQAEWEVALDRYRADRVASRKRRRGGNAADQDFGPQQQELI